VINYNVLISIERRAPGKTKTTTTNNNQREQTQKTKDEQEGSNKKNKKKCEYIRSGMIQFPPCTSR
jgi:hypothetical protein